jgi:hypothetical protein
MCEQEEGSPAAGREERLWESGGVGGGGTLLKVGRDIVRARPGEKKAEWRAGGGVGEGGGARERELRWRLWSPHFLYLLGSENNIEVPLLPQTPSHKSPRQRFSSWLSLSLLEGTKCSQGRRGGREGGSHPETSIRGLWPRPVPSQGGGGGEGRGCARAPVPV